jgi:hypothetical protein
MSRPCDVLTYSNVTPTDWASLKAAALSQYEITVPYDSGTQSRDGFTISWSYAAQARRLEVQCTDSPWVIPNALINAELDAAIQGVLKATPLQPPTPDV